MNCPYCGKAINAFTGLQEAQKFQQHLRKCRKYPGNMAEPVQEALPDNPSEAQGARAVRTLKKVPGLWDAVAIRDESGQ